MRHFKMFDFAQYQPTPFLALLTADRVERLKREGHRRTLGDGQFVHSRGDENPGISVIEDGAAQAGIYGLDGSFILTSYIGPGHTFGEFTVFTTLPRTHDISAVGETTIVDIPALRFLTLCEDDPNYMTALLQTTLMRSHLILEMLHAVRSLPLVQRAAKFLLILSPPIATDAVLKFRQSDLASTLGVSRASMNEALARLQSLGLIERGYGHVRILRRDALGTWLNTQTA
ncbi:MAG: Crp/Fnr family transcriptional regulator [Pseudomonadota bacterium]|nr:Crp/Fnr family transcriptional regulator [Pseudomonadota bacterium]